MLGFQASPTFQSCTVFCLLVFGAAGGSAFKAIERVEHPTGLATLGCVHSTAFLLAIAGGFPKQHF